MIMTLLPSLLILFNYFLISSSVVEEISKNGGTYKDTVTMTSRYYSNVNHEDYRCEEEKMMTKHFKSIKKIKRVKKWKSCKKACNENEDCKYFKYNKKKKVCSLMEFNYIHLEKYISGGKYCHHLHLFHPEGCDMEMITGDEKHILLKTDGIPLSDLGCINKCLYSTDFHAQDHVLCLSVVQELQCSDLLCGGLPKEGGKETERGCSKVILMDNQKYTLINPNEAILEKTGCINSCVYSRSDSMGELYCFTHPEVEKCPNSGCVNCTGDCVGPHCNGTCTAVGR